MVAETALQEAQGQTARPTPVEAAEVEAPLQGATVGQGLLF